MQNERQTAYEFSMLATLTQLLIDNAITSQQYIALIERYAFSRNDWTLEFNLKRNHTVALDSIRKVIERFAWGKISLGEFIEDSKTAMEV